MPRLFSPLLLLLAMLLPAAARAQTARDLGDIALNLYQQANSPGALERRRQDLVKAPEAYLVAISQPGTLVMLPDQRRVKVPALRYNVALRLLEVQDSTGFHVWPPGSLAGFYLGRGPEARHFRSYKVRTEGPALDFVEVLTAADNAPLLLAVQHRYVHDDPQFDPVLHTETRPGRSLVAQRVIAGPGNGSEPLRELPLTQRYVGRLFGAQAAAVATYAQREHLGPTDLAQVLRQVEYFNQLAAPAPGH